MVRGHGIAFLMEILISRRAMDFVKDFVKGSVRGLYGLDNAQCEGLKISRSRVAALRALRFWVGSRFESKLCQFDRLQVKDVFGQATSECHGYGSASSRPLAFAALKFQEHRCGYAFLRQGSEVFR